MFLWKSQLAQRTPAESKHPAKKSDIHERSIHKRCVPNAERRKNMQANKDDDNTTEAGQLNGSIDNDDSKPLGN